jgi:PPOX class probable F420-dependent enzyme
VNEHLLDPLDRTWAVLLRTRKRDGSWVDTPVNVAVAGDRADFGTAAATAKVKRLRNFPDVEIAPCTFRGTPTGPALGASARLLDGDEAIAATRLLRSQYRFVYRVAVPLELWIKRTHGLVYELSGIHLPAQQRSNSTEWSAPAPE